MLEFLTLFHFDYANAKVFIDVQKISSANPQSVSLLYVDDESKLSWEKSCELVYIYLS